MIKMMRMFHYCRTVLKINKLLQVNKKKMNSLGNNKKKNTFKIH